MGGILSGRLIRFASTASALARRCRKSSPASGPWGAAAAVGEGGCEVACEGGCEGGCKGCFGNRFLRESEKRRSRPGALWGVDGPVPLSVRRVTGALLGRARLCASFFLWDDGGRLGGITQPARVKWLRPENRKRVRRAVHACVKLAVSVAKLAELTRNIPVPRVCVPAPPGVFIPILTRTRTLTISYRNNINFTGGAGTLNAGSQTDENSTTRPAPGPSVQRIKRLKSRSPECTETATAGSPSRRPTIHAHHDCPPLAPFTQPRALY